MKLSLQTIKSVNGKPEYVLLPIFVYEKLQPVINKILADEKEDYVDFNPENFIKNPIALKRMKAKLTQEDVAAKLNVSQAYISKIEQDNYDITKELFKKLCKAIEECERERQ